MAEETGSLTDEEKYETTYHYFVKALRVMAADARTQCKLMGNINVAWELQHDVTDGGTALLNLPVGNLTELQKEYVRKFIAQVNNLPKAILVAASSAIANEKAMNDPSWAQLREDASRLILYLAR